MPRRPARNRPRRKWTLTEGSKLQRLYGEASNDGRAGLDLLGRLHLLRVADVMTTVPVEVSGKLSARRADRIARARGVHYLLVALPGHRTGAVCLYHLRNTPPRTRLADCICDPAWIGALAPQLPIEEAAAIMNERAFRCLPVVAGHLLLGVLTGGDLRRAGVAADLATPRCASCGGRFHVRSDPGGLVAFCTDCRERAQPPGALDEIGVGD